MNPAMELHSKNLTALERPPAGAVATIDVRHHCFFIELVRQGGVPAQIDGFSACMLRRTRGAQDDVGTDCEHEEIVATLARASSRRFGERTIRKERKLQ